MLGHEVCRTLTPDHEVHGICRNLHGISESQRKCFAACTMHVGFQALDEGSIKTYLARTQPDVVINCVGAVKQLPEGREPLHAIRINSVLPHLLARECSNLDSKLIQVSTDCAFSGQKGNYSEDDIPDPVDVYGKSKVLGEIDEAPHLTIRTSIMGPQLRGRTGLFEWFRGQRDSTVHGFGKFIYSGLTTKALAEVLGLVLSEHPALTGLFHVSSAPISKHELLLLINAQLELGITVQRDDSLTCDRSLDSSRFRRATGIKVPSHETMIGDISLGAAKE